MRRSISCARSTSLHQSARVACQLVLVGRNDADGARWAELARGDSAIAMDSAVTGGGAPVKIFGEKQNHRDAMATVHGDFVAQFGALVALDETQVDLAGIYFGDALDQRTLLDAVAAPDAADDENVHLADEAAEEFALRGCDAGGIIDALPALLLVFFAGSKIFFVAECGGKLLG